MLNRRSQTLLLTCLIWLACSLCLPANAQERISHGRFEDVTLYRPKGEVKQFVLFLSGDNAWNGVVTDMAQMLTEKGAMVAGVSVPQLFSSLEADGGKCVFPDGDLENLAHYIQGYARLKTYHTPLLVGYSSGATLAYAMIAQAPTGTFLGAVSLGFCPDMDLAKPLCKGEGVHFTRHKDGKGVDMLPAKKLAVGWVALHGTRDHVCATNAAKKFVAQVPGARFVELPNVAHWYSAVSAWQPQFLSAYDQLTANTQAELPPPPSSLSDLPLVEVRAPTPGDTFAILISGDGGWAGLDKKVAAALAGKGVDVVGLDSLRYFWSKRTPQGLASDVDRVIRYYATHWHKPKVILMGYSQGADVMPFVMNRLPSQSRQLVVHTVLMGLGENASFEFHVGNWLGGDQDAIPILPEASKLSAQSTLCIYGSDEDDSLCPKLAPASAYAQSLPGGHHFDGAYEELADLILERIASQSH
ncbi:MAG: AcvB/VirJ family lysyl-phosphatidylglycerol hydrolase [Povalibacter sp.]